METWQFIIILLAALIPSVILVALFNKIRSSQKSNDEFIEHVSAMLAELEAHMRSKMEEVEDNNYRSISELRIGLNESFTIRLDAIGRQLSDRQAALESSISLRLDAQQQSTRDSLDGIRKGFDTSVLQNEARYQSFEKSCLEQLKLINDTLEGSIRQMRESNDKHMDGIRATVDEKLQRTLNERFAENFQLISERLAEVHKGLGEMQSLAAGVGDLKKVLSNVKTAGNLGELQLGAILAEILAPEQYVCNFDAKKKIGNDRVEFAIKMPTDSADSVYLPVDSKFPVVTYQGLMDAYDIGDPETIENARKTLTDTLKNCAKTIRDKYINPPRTTDFAIMFLPTEGLYAEAVRIGLIEKLQHDYRVNLAGPSTMAVLLNSLRMGFQTIAIQKRSNEVWKILADIKKEFQNFGDVLEKTQRSISSANSELDKLIGVRTRAILRTLKDVENVTPMLESSGNTTIIDS